VADIKRALARSPVNDLRQQLALERENQLRAFQSEDAASRIAAFLEKRGP
jgi:enoyl-CoA hydratase/carnithine racemase